MKWTKTRSYHRFAVAPLLCAFLIAALATSFRLGSSCVALADSSNSVIVLRYDPVAIGAATSPFVSGTGPLVRVPGPVVGTDINALLGANAFYSQGYTGANVVVANIEAGHIWTGHETMTHVLEITNHPEAINEVDRHGTAVGMLLGGRLGGANPGEYQRGMAPDAQLYTGALAAQWTGTRYTGNFNYFFSTLYDQYRRAFSNLTPTGRPADVINSSIGFAEGGDGSGASTMALDAFANTYPRTLFVNAAGNSGPGPDQVVSPGAGYNDLTVASLGPAPTYNQPSSFSSGGPNDYFDVINGLLNNVRQVVDIAAPGQELTSAFYHLETGGNGTTDNPFVPNPPPSGPPIDTVGGPNYYSRGIAGTSFASPTAAGGAALLYDAAYGALPAIADSRDARVIKAVLMNSADKTVGWNNGQLPNVAGGVSTTQGLDNRVGTGRMNLAKAYDQLLGGTTDVAGTGSGNLGQINATGWDFGQVMNGTPNDYYFSVPLAGGAQFTATLTWFRDRTIDISNNVIDFSYDNLDLELWQVAGGNFTTLISQSNSVYNNSEHFSFGLPTAGDYALRVRWFGEIFDQANDLNQELYALAWKTTAVPEPGAAVLLSVGALVGVCLTRRELATSRL
jgi:hypothetical protein